jgi:predicted phage terminase large subunit-like protein
LALVNGEWLSRIQRQERIDIIRQLIDEYEALAKSGNVNAYDVDQWEALDIELVRLERVHACEYDMLQFMHEYFSEELNPDNPDNLIPAGVKFDNAAEFHTELCGLLDEITYGKRTSNTAWSVGRNHAKTAYLSNGYLCHQTVYRHKRYIVEVSETTDVAGDFIQWARNQIVHNEKLRNDFGELLNAKKSMNDTDNKYEFVTSTGTKVEAKGIGTQMRGLRHGATRPDLFLLDDLESKDNTNTPELRKKNRDWFREEMLPALSREGICVYMGTIVHYDSVLNYVIKERRDFVSRKFPAILEWSEREDLWQRWREIYREDRDDAVERAQTFYDENKAEMIRGTRTLWAARFSYLDLMMIQENDGAKAFNQEYLGNPTDPESQVFVIEEFSFYDDDDIEGVHLDWYCGIDFAMGKEKGDYSAIINVGRSPNGIFYVEDPFIQRVHPDILLTTAVEHTLRFQYEVMGVEAQQAQEWWADKLAEALHAKGYPAITRLKQIKQRTRKSLRIESLLPDIQSGKIRFRKHQRLLLEMFELYPSHNHDDGPDALSMALTAAKTGNKRKASTTGSYRY